MIHLNNELLILKMSQMVALEIKILAPEKNTKYILEPASYSIKLNIQSINSFK